MHQWVLSQLFCIFLISYLNTGHITKLTLHAALLMKHCSEKGWDDILDPTSCFSLSLFLRLHSWEIQLLTQSIAFRQQSFLLSLGMKLVFVTQVFQILVIKGKMSELMMDLVGISTGLRWASLALVSWFTGGAQRFQVCHLVPCRMCPLQSCRFYSFDTWTTLKLMPL